MKIIDVLIVFCCIIALSVSMYDLYRLDSIEDRCLYDCNEHWVNELETKCQLNIDNMIVPTTLMNYSYDR